MTISNQFLSVSLKTRSILVCALTLLFFGASLVVAQDNTNANQNTGSANVNGNANANTGSNTNQNQNGNGNVNGNDNQSAGKAGDLTDPNVVRRQQKLLESYWYYVIVILMFGLVLVPFAWVIMRSIKYSSATYRSPLGLPDGSLRAMLAFTLVSFVGFYVMASILSFSNFEPPQFLLGIVATVIGFYFGSRSSEDRTSGSTAAKTGNVAGTVSDATGAPADAADVQLTHGGVDKGATKTDVNGTYKFENLAIGDYTLKATKAGQSSDPKDVKVQSGETQTVPLALK